MRNLKIFLWMFIIFLLQTVVLTRVHVYSSVPSLVLPYVVCVMLLESEWRVSSFTAVICSVSAGALCGRNFAVMTLYLFYAAIIVRALKRKPVYVNMAVKAFFWTFVLSGALEIILFFVRTMTVNVDMLLYAALPTAVINTVFALVLYPILSRTMYKEEKTKLLIGDLV